MSNAFELKPSRKKLRNFLFSLFALALIFAIIMLIADKRILVYVFAGISGYALLTGLLFPPAGYLIYYPWIGLGWLLAHTISPIIIAIIYYIVVTSTALIMRLTGRDRLRLKKSAQDQSFWQDAAPFEKEDFEKMF